MIIYLILIKIILSFANNLYNMIKTQNNKAYQDHMKLTYRKKGVGEIFYNKLINVKIC